MRNKNLLSGTFILFCAMTTGLNAQNYYISFAGSGQSTTVETVEVKNLTRQTTLSLSGDDVLNLTSVTGINETNTTAGRIQVYPNPVSHFCLLEFSCSSPGITTVEIYDYSGRIISQTSQFLPDGLHVFNLGGLSAGIHLVKVNTPEHTFTQRIISVKEGESVPVLSYAGITQGAVVSENRKSTANIVAMNYSDGERLLFKGTSGDFAHTVNMIPDRTQYIIFEFMNCTDGDGNKYGVVTIGDQAWMAENLKTTKYRNGTEIEYPGTDNAVWGANTNGAYAWYNNDISWKDKYGALYNWYAVANVNGLCPEGWHVPTDAEWLELTTFLGGTASPNGNKLKSCRQENSPLGGICSTSEHPRWKEHGTHYGTNTFGFGALPADMRTFMGHFGTIGEYCDMWSSTETEAGSNFAWDRYIDYNAGGIGRYNHNKRSAISVRCIKDAP